MNVKQVAIFGCLVSFLVASAIVLPALGASQGIGASPSVLDFGQLAQGESATHTVILYNTGDGQLNWTATTKNLAGVEVSPNSGVLAAKSNIPLVVTATGAGAPIPRMGTIHIETKAAGKEGTASMLPAIDVSVHYRVSGQVYISNTQAGSVNQVFLALVILGEVAVLLGVVGYAIHAITKRRSRRGYI